MDINKYELALKCIENETAMNVYMGDKNTVNYFYDNNGKKNKIIDLIDLLDICHKALKFQIPQTIKIKQWCSSDCPNCKEELSEHCGDGYYSHPTHLKMCPYCGQKIEWTHFKTEYIFKNVDDLDDEELKISEIEIALDKDKL